MSKHPVTYAKEKALTNYKWAPDHPCLPHDHYFSNVTLIFRMAWHYVTPVQIITIVSTYDCMSHCPLSVLRFVVPWITYCHLQHYLDKKYFSPGSHTTATYQLRILPVGKMYQYIRIQLTMICTLQYHESTITYSKILTNIFPYEIAS